MDKMEAIEKWLWLQESHWTRESVADLQELCDQKVLEVYKRIKGKKTSDVSKAWRKFTEEERNIVNAEIRPYQDETTKRYNALKETEKEIENELKVFAKSYQIESSNDMFCNKRSNVSDYHTQGWGASKYAKNYLMDDFQLLQLLGFKAEIRFREADDKNYYSGAWELWSNLNAFNFAMLKYSGKFVSVLNWAVNCWQNGSNPKVYFPFLSQDDYDKSQFLAYHTGYKVTAENMMTEISWEDAKKLEIAS